MNALRTMTLLEAKIVLRDKVGPLFAFLMPVMLLFVFGLTDRESSATDSAFLGSLCLALGIAMVAIYLVPSYMASYREHGILRRLSVSPVPPSRLLIAQLLVNATAGILVVALIVLAGHWGLGIPLPASPVMFVAVTLLMIAAMLSLGLIVAAVARNTKTANLCGQLLFWPNMVLGGIWVKRSDMPGWMRVLGDHTPMGGGMQAVQHAWLGESQSIGGLFALALCTVLFGALAARLFRWQ
ncbi:ABC transporter permease [Pseudonocardiaceae bacterium YIM PH 21723]|nr:ABC transporter permease [Pseudonocardiaceae bacterium YIM PH 21723]